MDLPGRRFIQEIKKTFFYSFRTGLLEETRLQIIPVMDVKLNKS